MAEPYQKSSMRDTFESLVVTVILAIFGTTFVVQAFKIPTGSMENTLLIGDHLLVNKFAFSGPEGVLARFLPYRQIHRDDILVFKYPGGDEAQEPGEHFVKRVVGLPGDHIRVVNRKLYVNGRLAPASFVRDSHQGELLPGDDFPTADWAEVEGVTPTWREEFQNYVHNGEIVVPEGEYFVMGDNREESWDSRFWGFVPRNVISGRPLVIYWSYETPQNEYMQNSFGERVEQIAALIFHFFGKTRWKRTFNLVR